MPVGSVGDAQLRLALDHVPAYVFIKDGEGRYLYANRALLERFDRTEEELPGVTDAELFSEATVRRLQEVDRRVLAGEHTQGEVVVDALDGTRRVYWEVKTPLQAPDGGTTGPRILGISTDITAYKQLEEQLSRAAMVDPLTDLPNRRRFLERLEEALVRSDRTRSYGCLLFLDVDGFKGVNDTHGHLAGDRLLVQVATRIRGLVRRADHVARLGGDEFVVLSEDLGEEEPDAHVRAGRIADKLRRGVAGTYDLGDVHQAVRVSVGAALFRGLERSIDEVLSAADARMYEDKRGEH
ncbi:MAG: diguanylate cyclase domain-containing protein [Nitriliruptoraceae bacterium]